MMHEIGKQGMGFSRTGDLSGKEGFGLAKRILHGGELPVEVFSRPPSHQGKREGTF